MAGQVHALIDKLIALRSHGNPTIANTTRVKLMLKGIKAEDWTSSSKDDAAIIAKLHDVAKAMGVALKA